MTGAASSSRSASCSAPRPRWCSPWTEPSVLPSRRAISPGESPAMWRRTSTSRCSAGRRQQRVAQALRALEADLLVAVVVHAHLLERDLPARTDVVQGHIASDPEDPGRERHVTRLVAVDRRHQLGEYVLRDVLGLVGVTDDAAHVAADVVGEADVQEVQRTHITLLRAGNGRCKEVAITAMFAGAGAAGEATSHGRVLPVRSALSQRTRWKCALLGRGGHATPFVAR